MPKIPDYTALDGALPQSRRSLLTAGEAKADVSGAGAMRDALGRGLKRAGDMMFGFGIEMKEKSDSLDVLKADAHYKTHMARHVDSFDADPAVQDYELRFDTGAAAITKGASDLIRDAKLRERFLLQKQPDTEARRASVVAKGRRVLREKQVVDLEDQLRSYRDLYAARGTDEATRAATMEDIYAAIALGERSGILDPSMGAKLRDHYVSGTVREEIETRLLEDPKAVADKLSGGPAITAPLAFDEAGQAIDADGAVVPGVMRYTGAASEAALAFIKQKEGFRPDAYDDFGQMSSGYGTKALKPGERISRTEADKRLRAQVSAITTWIDQHIKVPLTQAQADALVSFGYNLGTDDLARLKEDINDGKFGRVAKRMLTFNRAGGTELPGLVLRRQQEAEMFLGRAPIGRYAALSPKERAAYVDKANVAMRQRLEGRREEIKRQLDDDIVSLRETGVPVADIDLETAEKILEPNQIKRYRMDRAEAIAIYQAVSPIPDLPGDALASHLESLEPKPGSKGYAAQEKVYQEGLSVARKVLAARGEDPALAVNDSPEVQREVKRLGGEVTHPAQIARARLDAQERLGIPPALRRPITRVEAKAILAPIAGTEVPGTKAGWIEIMNQIDAEYGPRMAPEVLKAAIAFAGTDQERTDLMTGLLQRAVRDGPQFRAKEYLRQFDALDQIDDELRGLFGEAPRRVSGGQALALPPELALTYRVAPNERQIAYLRNNLTPENRTWFDRKFGPGAAEAVLTDQGDE